MTVETRYFRSDIDTVNGLTTEKLRITQSGTSGYKERTINDPEVSIQRVYFGIRVWKRSSAGAETEITVGTPVASVYRNSAGQGIQSSTWNCPQTVLSSTDNVVIRLYYGTMEEGTVFWFSPAIGTWHTEQLNATVLNTATWTVYYYTWLQIVGGTPKTWTWRFYFDTATYNSHISNVTYGESPAPSANVKVSSDGFTSITC